MNWPSAFWTWANCRT